VTRNPALNQSDQAVDHIIVDPVCTPTTCDEGSG
jgi:hypothetical protein